MSRPRFSRTGWTAISVLDLDAAHDDDTADEEPAGERPRIGRRPRLVLEPAEERHDLRHHAPSFRHPDLDAAPHRESVDHRALWRRLRVPQVDLDAAHERHQVAAAIDLGIALAHVAAHEG